MCSPGTSTGPSSLLTKTKKVDTSIDRTYVHTDIQYMFQCCGVVEQWKVNVQNPGNLNLQVWRPTGTTLKLVGQNKFSITTKGTKTLPVAVVDRATVQYGDYIGWFSDAEMITYNAESSSDAYSLQIIYDAAFYAGGGIGNWPASTALPNRLYAVIAYARENSPPSLTNLTTPQVYNQSDLNVGDTVLTGNAFETDRYDYEYLTLTRQDVHTVYFTSNLIKNTSSARVDFVVNNIPPVGNYTLRFLVVDICSNSVAGKVDIIIKYKPLKIQSLPADVTIRNIQPGPLSIHSLVVRADLTFVCKIGAITPSAPAGAFIIDKGKIKVVDPTQLSAPTTYNISITCTDTSGSTDTGYVTLNTLANTVPRVIAYIDSVLVDAQTTFTNDLIHRINVTDDDGDFVTISSYCDQTPCPFDILGSGKVICNGSLAATKTTKFVVHFRLSDGYNTSAEYILYIYLQNINTPPYITNLIIGQVNTIFVSESTAVGSLVFDANGADNNTGDVLAYNFVFDPITGGSNYFIHSVADGSLTLTKTLNISILGAMNVTEFTANVSVTDGKESSGVYIIVIKILPAITVVSSTTTPVTVSTSVGTPSTTAATVSSPAGTVSSLAATPTVGTSTALSGTGSTPVMSPASSGSKESSQLSLINVILIAVLGILALLSAAMCCMLVFRNSRKYKADLNSSRTDLIPEARSKLRVFQVQPSGATDPIVDISKPRMSPVN